MHEPRSSLGFYDRMSIDGGVESLVHTRDRYKLCSPMMVQEETMGTRKGTVRTTAAGINKPAKGEDESDGYGEHRLWRDV
jgi:hypothetical protein